MKFIVNSKELSKRVSVLNKVVKENNVVPILDHILFTLSDRLTLTSTDLETTVKTSINVEKTECEGSVCIQCKLLTDLLKECKDEPLTFECEDSVKVTTSKGTYTLIWCNADDFPLTSEVDGDKIVVPSKVLLEGITKASFAMGDDELRPVMNGIYVETDGKINFVATNAHKLCWVRNADYIGDNMSFILPRKSALLIKGFLKDKSVTIISDDRNVKISDGEYEIVARRVEGRYPAFRSVIPVGNDKTLKVNKDELLGSIKRVGVFSNKASGLIAFEIGKKFTVSAQDLDFGVSATEDLNFSYEGEPISIGFKKEFLTEIISNIEGEVQITMSSPERASLFEYDDVTMLLMPMMIR